MNKNMDGKLLLLSSLFIMAFVLANFLASKTTEVGPFTFTLGLLAFPIMFVMTDVITEVYGKETSLKLVKSGFVAMVAALILTQIAVHLPPAESFKGQEAFAMIFGAVPRITLASLVAYLFSQYHDVWAFSFWKKKTNGKHLWLRNNLSTIVSQLLDSIVFIGVAFIGTFSIDVLISMVLGQWLVKVTVAVLETPIVYSAVYWVKK